MKPIDSEDLWRRVGLEALREAVKRVQAAIPAFEQALAHLPPCNTCAQAALLEQVHAASVPLSSDVINLAILAKTLEEAMAIAQQTQAALTVDAPAPCACAAGPCACHE